CGATAMNQIMPYPLWIGHAGEDRDFRNLFGMGIRALIQLAVEEPSAAAPRELICRRFPLLDGARNDKEMLYLAVNTLACVLRMHVPTLVCCGGGVSRAPAVAAVALAAAFQEAPERCLQRIVEHHPSDVSPGLWKEVTAVLPALP